MKVITDNNGVIFRLGQNADENWELLDKASGDDIFFHLSKFPSCYVIMEKKKMDVTLDTYIIGAEFCKSGTKYRTLSNIKVDYCECENLIKGEKTGQVIFKSKRKVKTLMV